MQVRIGFRNDDDPADIIRTDTPLRRASPHLRLLLRDLLSFHSSCVLLSEGKLRDCDIIQNDIECKASVRQDAANFPGDHLTLSQKLRRVVLGNDGFKRLYSE